MKDISNNSSCKAKLHNEKEHDSNVRLTEFADKYDDIWEKAL